MKALHLLCVFLVLLLSGCSSLLPGLGAPTPTPSPPVTATIQPTRLQTGTPTSTATPSGPLILRLWVPPVFDPSADTPAGQLLRARLNEFLARRPDMQIEVRVKDETGTGGLYESLATSTAAAQGAMPDLIALPHPLVQTAAINGLLRPMNGLTNALDDPDWYDFARQLTNLQNSIFGLPFAGNMLIQRYFMGEEGQPARNWEAVQQSVSPLVFSAADPQALFTLAMYLAAGGEIVDSQDRPTLEVEPLTEVLNFYKAAQENGVIADSITQLQTDNQAWESFIANNSGSVITWSTPMTDLSPENSTFDQIPTQDGKPFSLASGWVWSLTSPDPEKRQVAVELAEFLTDSTFLARWSEASGYLPTRPSALARWTDSIQRAKIQPIVNSARLYPTSDLLNVLGPALQEATLMVLKRQLEPLAAAQGAVNRVNMP